MKVARSSLKQVSVAYYERSNDRWVAQVWSEDVLPDIVTQICAGIPQDAPNFAEVERGGVPLFVDGWDATREHISSAESYGAVALLPVGAQGAVRGLFTLGTQDARSWTERERATLRALGRGLNLAVERANAMQHLTEERRKLEAANEELEAFAYSVSHDLRTPVRHIVSFSSLLRQALGADLNGRAPRYLTVIEEAAQRMHTLIDAMLDLSRTSRLPLRVTRVHLDHLVAQLRQELLPEPTARAVRWEIRPLPPIMGDADTLRQVMMNLLSNALKYSQHRDGAVIEVWAEERPAEWAVFVRDNGAGFDPRYTDKLFTVFQRLHRQDEFEGVGVGLANVRRIIQRHGGQVMASGVPGAGATFGFTLPKG
ncbi:hypothetical protein LAJ19_17305 (plasmid) [Deinococcus taeanensis]|uniref:sensor histidine kinase n=1 Tax=Deinococcus taeanensis TaxID=2737050 RepID=UPI001CDC2857|nr:ATP-binding protein [Deinococcus taeanensis]UBV44532.1 hypothetical protein LAJ19_17305 [Deinococcus taeanensis]